jgi:hypothetical protein
MVDCPFLAFCAFLRSRNAFVRCSFLVSHLLILHSSLTHLPLQVSKTVLSHGSSISGYRAAKEAHSCRATHTYSDSTSTSTSTSRLYREKMTANKYSNCGVVYYVGSLICLATAACMPVVFGFGFMAFDNSAGIQQTGAAMIVVASRGMGARCSTSIARDMQIPNNTAMKMAADNKKGEEDDNNNAILEDLSWRTAKIKLEEQHTQHFLKKRPVKLPYLESRRWVQYNLGPDTQEEFNDLVENGNLRTPYIPKRPEEYYTRTGDWISWEHFLTWDPPNVSLGCDLEDGDSSSLSPAKGTFD